MKPLRPLRRSLMNAKGVTARLSMRSGDEIAEGDFWTYSPRDLRRLAVWCEKAARRLEAVRKGQSR